MNCICGNPLDNEDKGFKVTRKPCLCADPRPYVFQHDGTNIVMLGDHPRDPKRAALGLPDRTPLEKRMLQGTFNE